VWIPPAELRDLRELTRVRMVLAAQRTRLKNRISATLAKYGLVVTDASDPYSQKARRQLAGLIGQLPPQTQWAALTLLAQLDFIEGQIREQEQRLKQLIALTPEMRLLMSLPGVGVILAAVIWLEIGNLQRFASAERLASYAGTTPRVHASGGVVRYGRLRPDVPSDTSAGCIGG
jgi:transposase